MKVIIEGHNKDQIEKVKLALEKAVNKEFHLDIQVKNKTPTIYVGAGKSCFIQNLELEARIEEFKVSDLGLKEAMTPTGDFGRGDLHNSAELVTVFNRLGEKVYKYLYEKKPEKDNRSRKFYEKDVIIPFMKKPLTKKQKKAREKKKRK